MKALVASVLSFLCCVSAFAKDEAKPAWKWTIEERIAKRLDPEEIRKRTLQKERDLVEKDGITPEIRISVGLPPVAVVKFVVEGRNDPELLMPWELFGSVLDGASPVSGDGTRRRYRRAIVEAGWTEEFFWKTLQEASSEIFQHQEERLAFARKQTPVDVAERRAHEMKLEAMSIRECGMQADALQVVRKKLGVEKFDRFLYEKVAPNVGIGSDFPFANEEWRLRFIEGGCR